MSDERDLEEARQEGGAAMSDKKFEGVDMVEEGWIDKPQPRSKLTGWQMWQEDPKWMTWCGVVVDPDTFHDHVQNCPCCSAILKGLSEKLELYR